MLKKKIEYIDFDGNKVEETLYFNLTSAEAVRLDLEFEGGLELYVSQLNEEKRPQDIMALFERLLRTTYGEKSEDGRHFVKTPEMQEKFAQSAAYDALFVSLMQDTDLAIAFFTEVVSTSVPPQK